MKHVTIRFHTHELNYNDIQSKEYDWFSIYGEVTEILLDNAPKPLGKPVTLTDFIDVVLFHNSLIGRSVTGILHKIDTNSIEWYSKK